MTNQIWKKKKRRDEHELRCGICDNKMIRYTTTVNKVPFVMRVALKKNLDRRIGQHRHGGSVLQDKYKLHVKGLGNHTQLRRTQLTMSSNTRSQQR